MLVKMLIPFLDYFANLGTPLQSLQTQASTLFILWNFPQIWTELRVLVVDHSSGVQEVVGSIPSQVIRKTLKMVLDASLLSARYLKDYTHFMITMMTMLYEIHWT